MTSLALQLDNVDVCSSSTSVCDSAEQITKLFPKCRPRSDVNLNPIFITTTKDDELIDNTALTVMNIERNSDRSVLDGLGSSEYNSKKQEEIVNDVIQIQNGLRPIEQNLDVDDENSDELIIDNSDNSSKDKVVIITCNKGETYKLRDSRIIEIAGGREIFSHSRSKASRKSRNSNNSLPSDELDKKKQNKSLIGQGVWELRGGTYGEVKKFKSAREFTETIFSSEVSSVKHQRPETQRRTSNLDSPPESARNTPEEPLPLQLQQQQQQQLLPPQQSPPSPTAGEVVVFDDIDESWKTPRLNYFQNNETDCQDAEPFENSSADETTESEPGSRITKIIGNLPIAEYEGSPRRYGPRHVETVNQSHPTLPTAHSLLASPSAYPPRPGFPQRVICSPTLESPEPDSGPNAAQMAQLGCDSDKSVLTSSGKSNMSTFDYLYEFSETRKVLEEFFKCPPADEENRYDSEFQDLNYELRRQANGEGNSYVGQRLAKCLSEQNDLCLRIESPKKENSHNSFVGLQNHEIEQENNFLDLSVGTGSSEDLGETEVGLQVGHSRNFTLSPETTDCDSNCGDLDSEMSLMLMEELEPSVGLLGSTGDLGLPADSMRLYSSMPVLEDGLSSGHTSDTDNNNPTVMLMKKQITEIEREITHRTHHDTNSKNNGSKEGNGAMFGNKECLNIIKVTSPTNAFYSYNNKPSSYVSESDHQENHSESVVVSDITPPPPAPAPHRNLVEEISAYDVEAAIKDIRLTLQRTKVLPLKSPTNEEPEENISSPIWVPRQRGLSATSGDSDTRRIHSGEEGGDEEEADTDLETDRLLGQQRTDDQGFYDEKVKGWRKPKSRTIMPPSNIAKSAVPKQIVPVTSQLINNNTCDGSISCTMPDIPGPSSPPLSPRASEVTSEKTSSPQSQKGSVASSRPKEKEPKKKSRNKEDYCDPAVLIEGVLFRARYLGSTQLVCEGQPTKTTRMMQAEEAVSRIKGEYSDDDEMAPFTEDYDNADDDNDTKVFTDNPSMIHHQQLEQQQMRQLATSGNATGTMFRLHYLGSVEVEEENGRKSRKKLKKNMVEEAVVKIKAPDGETQPSTEVDLFISTEKIMVLNTDLKEIMMDHALRTISYIADIGDLVVLMARRRFVPHEMDEPPKISRTPKMICHVFESEEAQFIAQSIGQAFQVAYMEFLKANGIEDHSFVKEMDYQEVLNSQEIFGDELQMFAKKEMQKEVVVPKAKGEILGVVIVESGWGSMLPTVVIANLAPAGAAARCGQLNIGDQIIAINGVSLVGLPLSTCQNYIKNSKNQTVVKLTVVPCAPVVEVKIKRPDTKYQLGFSVQNGVICSLLRGGIAERGGVRVGHRIIEINNQSVVAVPHEKIVNLLATSVGEILMKTMPTSMFRLLTGQENPVYI